MNVERSWGLQWRLAFICLLSSTMSGVAALIAFQAVNNLNLSLLSRLAYGFGAGLLIGLCGAVIVSLITRSVKLRLWEAGRMAVRIAGGDYQARLEIGTDDEIGWLEEQLNQMAAQLGTAVGSLRDLAEQNRRLAEEAGRGAALEERMRLSRDLHDTVNQQLFVMGMRIAAVKKRLIDPDQPWAELNKELATLENLARQAHSQIRDLILELRPVNLDQEGLGAALHEYFKTVVERESLQLKAEINFAVKPQAAVSEALFRIAQEALNNIVKHAGADTVKLELDQDQDSYILQVADNGVGFAVGQKVHPTALGLAGIRERVAASGGRLELNSLPRKGTSLKVVLQRPLPGGDEA